MARKDKSGGSSENSPDESADKVENHSEGAAKRTQPQRRFTSMVEQLESLGLKLRRVLGDGNCLFRALGDQIEGHTKHHLEFRRRTVAYMREHREFFEPFVDDTTSFERYVALLDEPGTHAGNDAIVAFAGSHEAVVVVHQLNVPLYHIGPHGREKSRLPLRELHVAYHNGDHYDSIRMLGEIDGIECAAMVHVPTIIRNPSQKLLPAGDDALRLRLSPKVEAKKNGLWGSDGSGRRLFGDETADLAMMLPAPSTTVVVGRRCDKEHWKNGMKREPVSEEAPQLELRGGFGDFDWQNGFSSR